MTSQRPKPKDQLGIGQAAERLGLSESFLSWALESGLLQGTRDGSGTWKLAFGEAEPDEESSQPSSNGGAKAKETEPPLESPHGPGNGHDADHGKSYPSELENEIIRRMTADRLHRHAVPHQPATEPGQEPHLQPVPSQAPSAMEDGTLEKVEQIYQEQIAYLRRLLETREVVISQKDALIVQLTERMSRLAELALERPPSQFPAPQVSAPQMPNPAPETPAAAAPDLADPGPNQQLINERHDEALKNVRETLLMVREYLAQLNRSSSDEP